MNAADENNVVHHHHPTPNKKGEPMKRLLKRTFAAITGLTLVASGLMLAGCGGSGSGLSSEVVSGVAAVGAPLAGQVSLKDSSSPAQEKTTVIGSDGSIFLESQEDGFFLDGPALWNDKASLESEPLTHRRIVYRGSGNGGGVMSSWINVFTAGPRNYQPHGMFDHSALAFIITNERWKHC